VLFKLLICLFPDLNVGKFNHRFDENPNRRNIYNLNANNKKPNFNITKENAFESCKRIKKNKPTTSDKKAGKKNV
jgi:hypothetical protein